MQQCGSSVTRPDIFIELYPATVLTLQQMARWTDTNTSSKAGPNLRSITETAFVVSLLSAAEIMSVTRPLAVCLQEQRQDLPGALKLIHAAQKCLEDKRLHAEK